MSEQLFQFRNQFFTFFFLKFTKLLLFQYTQNLVKVFNFKVIVKRLVIVNKLNAFTYYIKKKSCIT